MKNIKGFTLIELLVVIVIIGLLTAVSTIAFGEAKKSSRDTKRKADLETMRTSLEMYRSDSDYYPGAVPAPTPIDPLSGRTYYYNPTSSPSPRSYELCTSLEVSPSPTTGGCIGTNNCGSATCNYRVINP